MSFPAPEHARVRLRARARSYSIFKYPCYVIFTLVKTENQGFFSCSRILFQKVSYAIFAPRSVFILSDFSQFFWMMRFHFFQLSIWCLLVMIKAVYPAEYGFRNK